MKILIDEIIQNPNQIRSVTNDDELQELAESIKEHGLLQPIKVRPLKDGYELVYGHRRIAAMQLLGWTKCDAIIAEVNDEESLLQAIAENLQRENLDILEEAKSYQTLVDRGYKLKEIADLVNKPQGRISNRLSILRLPKEVQDLVKSRTGQHTTTTDLGGISPDSASRISSAAQTPSEAIDLAYKVINERLNSQDIRELTNRLKESQDIEERIKIINSPSRNSLLLGVHEGSNDTKSPHNAPQMDTLENLVHRKTLWNLQRVRLEEYNHFTIGYSARTIEQFIELLKVASVDVLVDIRYVPISRFKSDFSKGNLDKNLRNSGIKYIHLQRLGIPSEVRKAYDKNSLFIWYDDHVDIKHELIKIEDDLKKFRLAFMCVEVDPQSCHRHRVSLYLEKQGFKILDL